MLNKDRLFIIMVSVCIVSITGLGLIIGAPGIIGASMAWIAIFATVMNAERRSEKFARWMYTRRKF